MTIDLLTTLIVIGAVGGGLAALSRRRVRQSRTWRATATPLASIIGSGFLVVAPLLAHIVGRWAPIAMLGITAFAYLVGWVVRFNINHLEPALANGETGHLLVDLERLSRLALGFAYVISVAFYLHLLASFVLRPFTEHEGVGVQVFTTVLLVAIGLLAWRRGLGGLEILEETAVTIKLAIIGGLLAGLALFDVANWADTVDAFRLQTSAEDPWTITRSLAGMLLVVQGFETSRYLGGKYEGRLRMQTMRGAQVLSAAIYTFFVLLMVPLFADFPTVINDTAILDAVENVTVVLVPLIIVAAASSQLSAAVADTAGGGGMLTPTENNGREHRSGYIAVLAGAAAIVWTTDIFAMIALASRAFAAYYLIQAILSYVCASRVVSGVPLVRMRLAIGVIASVLTFIVIFGIAAT